MHTMEYYIINCEKGKYISIRFSGRIKHFSMESFPDDSTVHPAYFFHS